MKLLREFFVIFLGNSLLVLVAWGIYGARIRNKFMTGAAFTASPQSCDDETCRDLRIPLCGDYYPQKSHF